MADELITNFETDIKELILAPYDDGRFNVFVNGQLVFSKKQAGRFPNKDEISEQIRALG